MFLNRVCGPSTRGPRQTRLTNESIFVCLLPPQPRPLRELDKRVMLELQRCVPVLPIIAKADTFDVETLTNFQETLRQEFASFGIMTLTSMEEFPVQGLDGSRCDAPLAIIASNKAYRRLEGDAGSWVLCNIMEPGAQFGRLYRWGLASCEDASDLTLLRRVITEGRYFIVSRCDQLSDSWRKLYECTIQCIAKAHHEIDLYEEQLKRWERINMPCNACKPPKPELGNCGAPHPDANHEDKAKKWWKVVFDESFQSLHALQREGSLHAVIEEPNGGGQNHAQSDEGQTRMLKALSKKTRMLKALSRFYAERLTSVAQDLSQEQPARRDQFPRIEKFKIFMQKRLEETIQNGLVRECLVDFVTNIISANTGFNEKVVREVVQHVERSTRIPSPSRADSSNTTIRHRGSEHHRDIQ